MIRIIIGEEVGEKVFSSKEIGPLNAVFITGIQPDNSEPGWKCTTDTISKDVPVDIALSALATSDAHWIRLISRETGNPIDDVYRMYLLKMAMQLHKNLSGDEKNHTVNAVLDAVARGLKELMPKKGKNMTGEM